MSSPARVRAPTGVEVRVSRVSRTFRTPGQPDVAAVDGLDLVAASGEFVAILGPSGCGKSTLLRMIAGLDRPDAGTIALRDAAGGAAPRNAVAYVFQDAHLLPWRDVQGNVALPLELQGRAAGERRDAAMRAIERVGLADAARRHPAQLSGGMRMRVSLARALVTEPRLLLLDEPFAALDVPGQRLVERWIGDSVARGVTVVLASHQLEQAAALAARAVVLQRGQIEWEGTAAEAAARFESRPS
jgi:NitT/TauT family transport system ATP-binding protein